MSKRIIKLRNILSLHLHAGSSNRLHTVSGVMRRIVELPTARHEEGPESKVVQNLFLSAILIFCINSIIFKLLVMNE